MKLIRNIIQKFQWAFEGLVGGFKSDSSIQLQAFIAFIVILIAFALNISFYDFIIVIIMCGLVIMAEFLNSAVEQLSNYACNNEYSTKIKHVKDLAAAAVLVVSITALIVGVMIFSKYLF